jgi:hypothetical protein
MPKTRPNAQLRPTGRGVFVFKEKNRPYLPAVYS